MNQLKLDVKYIVGEYNKGRSSNDIADELKVTTEVVTRRLKSAGIKIRHKVSVNEANICEEYTKGTASNKIAKKYKISICSVIGILKKNNIEVRRIGNKTKFLELKNNIDMNSIIAKYKEGESAASIAKELDVKHHIVEKWLKDAGIEMRGMTAFGNCDETFFDIINTENKAYWLGFLAADGYIGDRGIISLCLKETDMGHLEKFKKDLCLSAEIKSSIRDAPIRTVGGIKKSDKGKNMCKCISFRSVKLNNKLKEIFIIVGGKTKSQSLNVNFNLIPTDMHVHFFRGLLDGDGYVSNTDKGFSLGICGTEDMCNNFKNYCDSILKSNVGKIYKSKTENVCSFSIYSDNAKKVFDELYSNADIFLNRKKNILDENYCEIIDNLSRETSESFLKKYHYMGSLPVATTCYGLIYGGKLSGVAVVGSACSPTVGASIGIKNEGICELRRFALRDNMPKNTASYFLSRVIKKIAGYNVLISYADSQAGHIGSIYQACNAIYLGCSQENRIVMPSGEIIKDNRYLFHQIKNNAQSLSGAKFETVSGKHKYIFILNEVHREQIEKLSVPYPKITKL